MSISGTSAAAAAVLLLGLVGGPPAFAENGETGLEWRGEATLGGRLYDYAPPFETDDLTPFLDKYRYTDKRDGDDPAWFVDLFHFDLGQARDDDTYLWRFERWSWNWINQHGELDVDWRGLQADLDYLWYRSDELRVFPQDTMGFFPTDPDGFATVYNPDTDPDNPLGADRRLFLRRAGVDGEIRLRPDSFGWELPVLSQAQVYSGYQTRKGYRQDRFLLDTRENLGGEATARFRGNRRELDQHVTTVGGGGVVAPWDLFTGAFDVNFRAFRENAPVVTLADLRNRDPDIGSGFTAAADSRALFFVPDTDRISGSLDLSRRFAGAIVTAGFSGSHLEQAGRRAPLQELLDLDDAEVTTWTAQAAFDAPLFRSAALNGSFKYQGRRNGFDEDQMARVAPTTGQVDPFYKSRDEMDGRIEATVRPAVGSLVGVGYHFLWVDRGLLYADPPGTIQPEQSVIDEKSQHHTIYVRGRTRIRRWLQLRGELGYEWAPEVAYARDLTTSVYFEGWSTLTLPGAIPASLSAFGHIRSGENDDGIRFVGLDESRTKTFERTEWQYGITLHGRPCEPVSLYGTFVQSNDEQIFPHLRSDDPRFLAPDVDFFVDSSLGMESDVKTLQIGGNWQVTPALDTRLSSGLTWTEVNFAGDNPRTKPNGNQITTGLVLDRLNEIRARILTVEAGIGYQVLPGLRFDFDYRFEHYEDRAPQPRLDPLPQSSRVHVYSLSVTTDLNLLGGG
ncbi:MAG: hypothetical protein O7G30_01170 [Proteobacteria bacterium]|nr:hypothetical protein [Pseudomonadota bacterium]